jgi:hypothetical protein
MNQHTCCGMVSMVVVAWSLTLPLFRPKVSSSLVPSLPFSGERVRVRRRAGTKLFASQALSCLLLLSLTAAAQPAISTYTLDQKISKIFLVSWPQPGLPEAWKTVLEAGAAGGVALSPGENYQIPQEWSALGTTLRIVEPPLLLAAPCEGGFRQPTHPAMGVVPVPEPAALGALGDTNLIRDAYTYMTHKNDYLAHLALAPTFALTPEQGSLDTEARSFSADPAIAAACIAAAIEGIQIAGVSAGVIAPLGVPLPEVIAAAMGPASLQVSPDLALEPNPAQAAVAALQQGCHLLHLKAESPALLAECKQAIIEALATGAVSTAQLDEAVLRIRSFPRPRAAISHGKAPEGNGVVVVRDAARLLPLDAAKGRVLVVAPGVEVGEPPLFIGHTLGNAIRALAAPTDEVRIELEPSPAQSEAALRKAAGADVIVFGALLPNVFTTQAELVRKLVETGKPLILVGLGDPGSILPLADLPTLVVAHGFSPPALDAAAAVLYGKQPPGGRLTAPIGRLFPAGHAGP